MPLPVVPLPEVAEYEAKLARLERRIAVQAAALGRVPLCMPVPPDVLALLALAPTELDGVELPPACLPRLAALGERVQDMIDNITLRERELAGRIAAVRSARRAGPAARLVDCSA